MNVDWHHAAKAPTALLILPWDKGVTIAHRDSDGSIHGCRDVTLAPGFAANFVVCVAAWIADARKSGLRVEDRANAATVIRSHAQRLKKAVKGITN